MSGKHAIAAIAFARAEENKRRNAQEGDGKPPRRKGSVMRTIMGIFPLLIIPVAIYNIMAFGFSGDSVAEGVPALLTQLSSPMMTIPMISGVSWSLTNGDVLLLVGIFFLFIEILKSTSTGTATILNHAASMMLFIVCLIEFLLVPNFATSVFFMLTAITLLDVLAGVVVTIVSARRDFGVGEGFAG